MAHTRVQSEGTRQKIGLAQLGKEKSQDMREKLRLLADIAKAGDAPARCTKCGRPLFGKSAEIGMGPICAGTKERRPYRRRLRPMQSVAMEELLEELA